ncbi:hypothetical protein NKH77_25690 [Streptomyces sp. M19]
MAVNPPIYDQLVQEQGDAVAEAREAADHTTREAENVLDWSRFRARPRAEPAAGPGLSAGSGKDAKKDAEKRGGDVENPWPAPTRR